jgi:hypothetical protein
MLRRLMPSRSEARGPFHNAVGIAPLDAYALFYAGLVISLAFACLIFVLFLFMRTPGPNRLLPNQRP